MTETRTSTMQGLVQDAIQQVSRAVRGDGRHVGLATQADVAAAPTADIGGNAAERAAMARGDTGGPVADAAALAARASGGAITRVANRGESAAGVAAGVGSGVAERVAGGDGGSAAGGGGGSVLIRYFAGARAAAGVAEERVVLAGRGSVADVLAAAQARRGAALVRVLPSCSFLLNGIAVHDHAVAVPDGGELDVLPPFAGG